MNAASEVISVLRTVETIIGSTIPKGGKINIYVDSQAALKSMTYYQGTTT